MIKQIYSVAATLVISSIVLTGCGGCKHEWKEATHITPKTCSVCGKIKGSPKTVSFKSCKNWQEVFQLIFSDAVSLDAVISDDKSERLFVISFDDISDIEAFMENVLVATTIVGTPEAFAEKLSSDFKDEEDPNMVLLQIEDIAALTILRDENFSSNVSTDLYVAEENELTNSMQTIYDEMFAEYDFN